MIYFGYPQNTGDVQCQMCGCWMHDESYYIVNGLTYCPFCRIKAYEEVPV